MTCVNMMFWHEYPCCCSHSVKLLEHRLIRFCPLTLSTLVVLVLGPDCGLKVTEHDTRGSTTISQDYYIVVLHFCCGSECLGVTDLFLWGCLLNSWEVLSSGSENVNVCWALTLFGLTAVQLLATESGFSGTNSKNMPLAAEVNQTDCVAVQLVADALVGPCRACVCLLPQSSACAGAAGRGFLFEQPTPHLLQEQISWLSPSIVLLFSLDTLQYGCVLCKLDVVEDISFCAPLPLFWTPQPPSTLLVWGEHIGEIQRRQRGVYPA